jgi:hypothetical protein
MPLHYLSKAGQLGSRQRDSPGPVPGGSNICETPLSSAVARVFLQVQPARPAVSPPDP